jgi:hypothetical protein
VIRRLPVLIALLVLVAAIPWKAIRLLSTLTHRAAVRSEVFELPQRRERFLMIQQALEQARRSSDILRAIQLTELLGAEFPEDAEAAFEAARTAAAAGSQSQALSQLQRAAELGYRKLDRLQSADEFRSLRKRSEYQQAEGRILEQSAVELPSASKPAAIVSDKALVNDRNTRWDPDRLLLVSEFLAPAGDSSRSDCNRLDTAAGRLVNAWVREGSASGLSGILYDNRDRGHSTLNPADWPGLDFVRYSPEVRATDADFGFRPWHRFNLPAFGNASTALVTPIFWRSNPRSMLTNPLHAQLFLDHYLHNHLYCAPEHSDFDPEHGDVYPANAPCWIISQGSSGSDQPFLQAIALTLAAFPPATRQHLESQGLLMHAVQWVLRQSQRSVTTPADYFTGLAHPVVFRDSQLDVERMVRLAHGMPVERIPALVRIEVVAEQESRHGVDYFSGGPGEQLITHPLLVSRIHRTTQHKRKIVLSASTNSSSPSEPVRFRWEVLQGDPQNVRIRPLDPLQRTVELTVAWHPPHPVRSAPELLSSRIDVGVFTEQEGIPSMPAIFCSYALAGEQRVYEGDRLVSIDYSSAGEAIYTDPLLAPLRKWKDTYEYNSSGKCLGWVRTQDGLAPQHFRFDGLLLVAPGSSSVAVPVQYEITGDSGQAPVLTLRPPGR